MTVKNTKGVYFNMVQKTTYFKQHDLIEQVLQHSTDIISVLTESGSIVYTSPSTTYLLGYESEEIVGKSLKELLHPDDTKRMMNHHFEYFFHKYLTSRIRRKEGDYIWIESMMQPMEDEIYSEEKLILCISRDITARKIAEKQVNDVVERYRRLVEHSHDTIGIISNSGTLTYINETGKKLFGATSTTDIIGKTIFEFTPKEEHHKIEFFIKNAHEDVTDFFETSFIRLDNDVRMIDMKLIPMNGVNRNRKQMIIRDITERKLTEEKLRQTEKLSVVGQLAAGIAHEIRNPLTAIKGFTQLLKEDDDNGYADVMLNELDRIDGIINDLLILAKPEIRRFETIHLNQLLDNLIILLETQAIMNNIDLAIEYSHEQIMLQCEPDKLKQVFINIIKNSFEAINEENGKVIVRCEKREKKEDVQITIIDNGVGIPVKRLEKLGEPFYSTKEKGTGLGLMICKKIIKDHNGSLHIASAVHEGTVVEIILPLEQKCSINQNEAD